MLVLFGSQATGQTHADSDWDFAVLYDPVLRQEHLHDNGWGGLEVSYILGEIFNLNSEKIDIVDLSNCQALIADSIAKNGKLLYEQEAGEFERFKQKAILTHQQKQNIRRELCQRIDTFLKEWEAI